MHQVWWAPFSGDSRAHALASLELALSLPPPEFILSDTVPYNLHSFPAGRPTQVTIIVTDVRDAALATEPPDFGTARLFSRDLVGTLSLDRKFFLPVAEGVSLNDLSDQVPVSVALGSHALTIWGRCCVIGGLLSSLGFASSIAATQQTSNFSHPSTIWPYWERCVPTFHTTALPQRVLAWKSLLGPFIGQAALAILTEGFVIPRRPHVPTPHHEKNHSTVELDPDLIDRICAKYMLGCVVEQVPRCCRLPMNIHAIGLVPKKSIVEPHRIIHYCRQGNTTILPWPSLMCCLAALSYLFGSKCWVFTLDLKAAYLSVEFKGCGGGLRRTGRALPDLSDEYIMGCSLRDGTCRGGCDKDLISFVWRNPMRLNATPFGMKVSSSSLDILTTTFLRRWRKKGVSVIIWVDST